MSIQHIRDDKTRTAGIGCVLYGMGGIGKTALAISLANRLKQTFTYAQIFIDLRGTDQERRSPLTSVAIMQRVIRSFHPDQKLPTVVDELKPLYYSILQQDERPILLLFDNASDKQQIDLLVPPVNCLAIVTSRWRVSLPGFILQEVSCLHRDASIALLKSRALRIGDLAPSAASVCGDLPLALEVFAGLVAEKTLYSVEELLHRLITNQERLSKVDSAFQLSFELLSLKHAELWTGLSLFPAGFDLAAVREVLALSEEQARDALQALVAANLVTYNGSTKRFRLHDLTQQFCMGKLQPERKVAVQRRHAYHYAKLLQHANKLFVGAGVDPLEATRIFDLEWANLAAGQQWAAEKLEEDADSARLCLNYTTYPDGAQLVRSKLPPDKQIKWFEDAVRSAKRLGDRLAEVKAATNAGIAFLQIGETTRATELIMAGDELAASLPDKADRLAAVTGMISLFETLGRYRDAANLASEWVADAKRLGDTKKLIKALITLAGFCRRFGEFKQAIDHLNESLLLAKEHGLRREEALAIHGLTRVYHDSGSMDEAISLGQQAVAAFVELNDRLHLASVLQDLGNVLLATGKIDAAFECYENQFKLAREQLVKHSECNALGNLGRIHATFNNHSAAIECFDQQVSLARSIEYRQGEANGLWNKAASLRALNSLSGSVMVGTAALAIYEAMEDHRATNFRHVLSCWEDEMKSQ